MIRFRFKSFNNKFLYIVIKRLNHNQDVYNIAKLLGAVYVLSSGYFMIPCESLDNLPGLTNKHILNSNFGSC